MVHIFALVIALGALGRATAKPPETTQSLCCQHLSKSLPSIYLAPNSTEYDKSIRERWSGTAILHPGCVIAPTSTNEVSQAVKIIVKNKCQFSVKSGGHNANPGSNSIDRGVSIDLSKLNTVVLSADRSHVRLGSGATWGLAYDTLVNENIGFPGGVCGEVGVGGPSLGGGQSIFQARKGWIVDNILNYEVVLASGEIVNANQTSLPDLFKALKGGNTNFGIMTHADVASFDFDGVWIGTNYVAINGLAAPRAVMLDKLTRAMVNLVSGSNEEKETLVQLLVLYPSGPLGFLAHVAGIGLTNAANVANPPAAEEFLALPNRISFQSEHSNMSAYAHHNTQLLPSGARESNAGITITNDFATMRELWDEYDKIYDALPYKTEVDWIIQFLPQPKIQQSYAKGRGGNSLGLDHIDKDQIEIWFQPRWRDAALDDMMKNAQQKFVAISEKVAKKHGTYSPFMYISYAAPHQQPLCGYGAESLAFLKKTATKYDPDGIFQTMMPGGFKLSKANCTTD
ncbi:hypothetical protein NLG97_g1122 [Lecanicillium saksenae]|uniref:Uncharacterized protein n=1 Tax=Lecanicillium saksenae TaxID=468837 RepID=A0ACC1R4L8_9HYPO|nr:hypothetical protein NLG97_g1122 [Lecanicillium saksenae]